MTRKELVDIFVASKDIDGKPFNIDRVDPILPFLIGDLMLSEYGSAVKGKALSHELKKLGSLWKETYGRFNRSFFSRYPRDAWDDIIDLMDSLTDALEDDLSQLRLRITLLMEDVPKADEERIVHLLTVYVLAQYAQVCWGQVYKVDRGGRIYSHLNQDIEKLKHLAFKMAVAYFKTIPQGSVGLSSINADGVFDSIARHLREWAQE